MRQSSSTPAGDSRPRTPATPAAARRSRRAGRSSAARRRRRSRRCSALASANLGVPVASLTVDKGVVSGGGKTVTYGAADRRQALQRQLHRRRRSNAGRQPPAKPVSQYKLVGIAAPPALRHPGDVTGKLHVRPQHPRARDAARPDRAAARPGRLRRRHEPGPVSVDESSIKHIPSVTGRAGRQLPRRRRAEGVRRDPGGRAAEGEVGDPPAISGGREPLEADAGARQRGPGAGARSRRTTGQRRRRDDVGREDVLRDTTSTTTRCTLRSARTSPSPT